MRGARFLPVILAAGMVLSLSACDSNDWNALTTVKGYLEEWATAKGFLAEDGRIVVNSLGRLLLPSMADAESGAALEAGCVVAAIEEADRLMEKGRRERDARAMDAAISLRPGDWRYYSYRAVLALEQHSVDGYIHHMSLADAMAQAQKAQSYHIEQKVSELTAVEARLEGKFQDRREQALLYRELAGAYGERYQLTRDPEDRAREDRYRLMASGLR